MRIQIEKGTINFPHQDQELVEEKLAFFKNVRGHYFEIQDLNNQILAGPLSFNSTWPPGRSTKA